MNGADGPAALVIDDDADFREIIALFIEAEGWSVLSAEDCVQGVALMRQARDRIALVFLDYWMPNMKPVHCAATIRNLARPGARVLLVSAAVDARQRAAELGLSEFLSKPLDFERLRNLLRTTKLRS